MSLSPTDIVFQSYGRCCNRPDFFQHFYARFMASSDQIRARFDNTDMSAQHHLLRHGILQLVLHARGMSDAKLRALGETHCRHALNIKPEWYDNWLDALVATIEQFDPEYSADVQSAWRNAITPGIDVIRNAY